MRTNLAMWPLGVLVVWGCAPSGSSSSSSSSSGGATVGLYCLQDVDCTGESRCRGGLCQASECAVREDCVSPLTCLQGECVQVNPANGCTSPSECPSDYVCDGFSRRCFNPTTQEYLGGNSSSSAELSSGAPGSWGSSTSGAHSGSSAHSTSSSSSSSSSGGPTVDLGGWRVDNVESATNIQTTVIPVGTRVVRGGLLIIARDCTRTQFENEWLSGSLPDNVTFLNVANSAGGVPIINGGEKFRLYDNHNHSQDGPTITGSTSKSFRRVNAGAAGLQANWEDGPDGTATPGVTNLPAGTNGVLISEWSDRASYAFEFIEIYVNP